MSRYFFWFTEEGQGDLIVTQDEKLASEMACDRSVGEACVKNNPPFSNFPSPSLEFYEIHEGPERNGGAVPIRENES